MPPLLRALAAAAGVVSAYLAMAIAMTWPLVRRLGDGILDAPNWHDALSNTMIVQARTYGLLGTSAIGPWDSWFLAPVSPSIVFNESLYGLAIFHGPLSLATGEPLWAYNVTLILVLALSGAAMHLLVRELTGSRAAAWPAGAAFAFCPYVFFQIGRIQLVALAGLPLTLYFLHRAFRTGRCRDLAGLGASWVLQVGTCLYYALFLLPPLGLATAWLAVRHRPGRRFWRRFGVTALATGTAAGLILAPYLLYRRAMGLGWASDLRARLSGHLADLAHVHPRSHALEALHYAPDLNKGEEAIAFPGITVTLFAAAALLVPLARGVRDQTLRPRLHAVAAWTVTALASLGAAVAFGTFLAALPVVALAAWYWRRHGTAGLWPTDLPLYLALAALVGLLWLGATPLTVGDTPVRGLYAYLADHVPGFGSMRKVSRQAAVLQLMAVVVAAFGLAAVLQAIPDARRRLVAPLLAALLTVGVLAELRHAPYPVRDTWSADTLPAAYRWLQARPDAGPIAALPSRRGQRLYRGEFGAARHNHLAAYHRHRTVNGKSTFMPAITKRFDRELEHFPSSEARFFLRTVGVRHLVVHYADLPGKRREPTRRALEGSPDLWTPVFRDGSDVIYALADGDGPAPVPAPTPPRPDGALEPAQPARVTASTRGGDAAKAADGDPRTRWSTRRPSKPGDWLAFDLGVPRFVAAVELTDFAHAFDAPRGWALEVSDDGAAWREVVRDAGPTVFDAQIQRPGRFVFRVVPPEPVATRHVRLRVLHGTSRTFFSVYEAAVLVRP